jgi:hypothetical protein
MIRVDEHMLSSATSKQALWYMRMQGFFLFKEVFLLAAIRLAVAINQQRACSLPQLLQSEYDCEPPSLFSRLFVG